MKELKFSGISFIFHKSMLLTFLGINLATYTQMGNVNNGTKAIRNIVNQINPRTIKHSYLCRRIN